MHINRFLAFAARLLLIAAAVWAVHLLIAWTMDRAAALEAGAPAMTGVLLLLIIAYAILIAIPFVPGVEIGVTLLMIEGGWIAPILWGSTLFGLGVSFFFGTMMPEAALERGVRRIGLQRVAGMIATIRPLGREARLEHLQARLPRWLSPLTRGQRYLLLALLINMPGNSVLGGGGGIMLLAGFSRLFALLPTIATMAIAVAPVPLLVYWFDLKLPMPGM